MSKFNYIGNANSDAYVCLVRTDAPVKTFADAFEKEMIMGASAEGASTRDFPALLRNLLGAKFKIVAGYPGTREINLALEKGEVQGACGETWSSVAATYPTWFKDNLVKPLVQESNVGYPQLDKMGVPLAREFAKVSGLIGQLQQQKVVEELIGLVNDGLFGTSQMTEIVSNLKDFSRLDRSKVTSFNLNDGLASTLMLA